MLYVFKLFGEKLQLLKQKLHEFTSTRPGLGQVKNGIQHYFQACP